MQPSLSERLRVLTHDQVEYLAALAVMDKTALRTEISSLERTTPYSQLHDWCLEANRKSRSPQFVAHVRALVDKTAPVIRRSRMRIDESDLPQARMTVQAYRGPDGECTFQETPYHAKSTDVIAWREKRGTDPEAQKDRWDPRPMRANHYDRAKMQPHKRRYGNA